MSGNPISTGKESHNANGRIPMIKSHVTHICNIRDMEKGMFWPPKNSCFAFPKAVVLKLFLESISNDRNIS